MTRPWSGRVVPGVLAPGKYLIGRSFGALGARDDAGELRSKISINGDRPIAVDLRDGEVAASRLTVLSLDAHTNVGNTAGQLVYSVSSDCPIGRRGPQRTIWAPIASTVSSSASQPDGLCASALFASTSCLASTRTPGPAPEITAGRPSARKRASSSALSGTEPARYGWCSRSSVASRRAPG